MRRCVKSKVLLESVSYLNYGTGTDMAGHRGLRGNMARTEELRVELGEVLELGGETLGIAQELDAEWAWLIVQAKELGLTVQEITTFLSETR